jgi:hypothetical protein
MMNNLVTLLKLLRWKGWLWLPGYAKKQLFGGTRPFDPDKTVHVVFLVVDHFEPSKKEGALGVERVQHWCDAYEKIAGHHTDSDGVFPQHSWFYRYDYPNFDCIRILSRSVFNGFGEVEFHLHHGFDTVETFRQKLEDGVQWFNQAGAMVTAEKSPCRRFAYIAGNWALDNGRRNPAMSGVNTELELLKEAGCYADFTFPAFGTIAQPQKTNAIYYAKDTPRPKSYNTGRDVKAGGDEYGDLMIFQGPLYVDWRSKNIEYASFEDFTPYYRQRIDYWMNANIHVLGRPEWIFIKLHTHGMQSRKTFLSRQLDEMCTQLEERFCSPPYKLHYVSAREAYNIVKAAEAGLSGDPNAYRDYIIGKPLNRIVHCNYPIELKHFTKDHLHISIRSNKHDTLMMFRDLPIASIDGGMIQEVELTHNAKGVHRLTIKGTGKTKIRMKEDPLHEFNLVELPHVRSD